jgi:ubiquinone/menaquinone biosynthesis C-methylase UbiE
MNVHPPKSLEERYFFFEQQEIVVHNFAAPGYILDIGGGGEGIIGILKGDKVVAIDFKKEELEEAAEGSLKIIMDARNLQFLDNTFDTATAFFSFMYIKNRVDYESIFGEVFRVLKAGGQFLIWDASIPQRMDDERDIFVIPVLVKVSGKEIETGYGQPWPEEVRDLAFYLDLAEQSGFQIVDRNKNGQVFFLQLQKPENPAGEDIS